MEVNVPSNLRLKNYDWRLATDSSDTFFVALILEYLSLSIISNCLPFKDLLK